MLIYNKSPNYQGVFVFEFSELLRCLSQDLRGFDLYFRNNLGGTAESLDHHNNVRKDSI